MINLSLNDTKEDFVVEKYLSEELMLVKFDTVNSKYDKYISTVGYKVINITDEEIIEFYDVEVIPTIKVFKNKNLVESIEGFKSKSELTKIILNLQN